MFDEVDHQTTMKSIFFKGWRDFGTMPISNYTAEVKFFSVTPLSIVQKFANAVPVGWGELTEDMWKHLCEADPRFNAMRLMFL